MIVNGGIRVIRPCRTYVPRVVVGAGNESNRSVGFRVRFVTADPIRCVRPTDRASGHSRHPPGRSFKRDETNGAFELCTPSY